MTQINLAIFASGSGTNAEEIIKYFQGHPVIKVKAILSNNPKAYVLTRARNHHIPHYLFSREEFRDSGRFMDILNQWEVDAIILAGFLWLIPGYLIERFPDRIINIHPALLPRFGGKGMYGMHVHKAVLSSQAAETGITIHLVNPRYDEGKIIFQEKCMVEAHDTPETLAAKVHQLEHQFYPKIIEEWLTGNIAKHS